MIKHCNFACRYLCAFITVLSGLLVPKAIAQAPPDMVALLDLKDRYIVSFPKGSTAADRAEAVRQAGATPLVDLGLINAIAVRIPAPEIVSVLRANSAVITIVPDRRIFALQESSSSTGLGSIAAQATKIVPAGVLRVGEPTTGAEGAGVGIMIADTGIDWTHPDLNVAPDKYDAFGGDCMDRNGHGTHVAGTAAALKNGIGVVGVAPGATLYCGKVLGDTGGGSDSNIIGLLQWVVEKNAAGANPPILVVNLSLGRDKVDGDTDGPLHEAIKALYKAGVSVIVAAGNDPSVEVKDQAPAGFPEVIAVASTTAEEGNSSRCPFSTEKYRRGHGLVLYDRWSLRHGHRHRRDDLSARRYTGKCDRLLQDLLRGHSINSDWWRDHEYSWRIARLWHQHGGPHVSGLAARLIESGISGTENVRARLHLDADRRGEEPRDSNGAAYTYDGEREGVAVSRR